MRLAISNKAVFAPFVVVTLSYYEEKMLTITDYKEAVTYRII